jgi:hypothetical protein
LISTDWFSIYLAHAYPFKFLALPVRNFGC